MDGRGLAWNFMLLVLGVNWCGGWVGENICWEKLFIKELCGRPGGEILEEILEFFVDFLALLRVNNTLASRRITLSTPSLNPS